jgi:hypothetical protein
MMRPWLGYTRKDGAEEAGRERRSVSRKKLSYRLPEGQENQNDVADGDAQKRAAESANFSSC